MILGSFAASRAFSVENSDTRSGLRFEGLLDLFLISHKFDNVNGVRCQRPTPAQRVCRGFKQ